MNQLDNGDWTPLSEAVSAQKTANVRLLLINGANPNTRSSESLIDSEEKQTVIFYCKLIFFIAFISQ